MTCYKHGDMVKSITNDVLVSVETSFQKGGNDLYDEEFIFAYRITIENLSESTIKLLRRHWFIVDSSEHREVEGEGVIGQQPVLEPGESHQYISACNLHTDMGKMYGTYLFERLIDGHRFDVIIPEFQLIVPFKNN